MNFFSELDFYHTLANKASFQSKHKKTAQMGGIEPLELNGGLRGLSTHTFKPYKGILVHFGYANLGTWVGVYFF